MSLFSGFVPPAAAILRPGERGSWPAKFGGDEPGVVLGERD
jgi:hypothetical protein